MARRIVIAGAGAVGASVAYHLAERGARDVFLCDVGEVASGATGRAMGGVRQQFSSAAEVRLTQASIEFFRTLGGELFRQVGYMFAATTPEGLARLQERAELQRSLGVPIEDCDAGEVDGLYVDDVLGAVICREDGVADPPAVAREVVHRAVEGGVELRERTDARALDADALVIACGWESREVAAAYGVELPIRPLCRQLVEVGPVDGLPETLPMVVEGGVELRERTDARALDAVALVIACGWESREVAAAYGVELPIRPLCRQLVEVGPVDGLPETLPMVVEEETGFHFRRRGNLLRLAWREPAARWTSDPVVDDALVPEWLARLAYRYPPAATAPIASAWAGLYDMTPDAHPIIGRIADGVFVAAGFSGHGFMQSPAVGRAVAQLVLGEEPEFDLAPYALERFGTDAVFPEELIL